MLRYRLKELIARREIETGTRLHLAKLAEETGISVQVLSGLMSPSRTVITNTANIVALCAYFHCTPNDLLEFDIPAGTYHIDQLFPGRRRNPTCQVPPPENPAE